MLCFFFWGLVNLEKIDNNSLSFRKSYLFSKRLGDIIISLLGLIISSPVTLLVSFLIKLEDGGSIFYTQTRIGKDGEKFSIYKFRSMVLDADKQKEKLMDLNEIDGAMFKIAEDPRITKIGKFIRKHSIDELPQLINVLIGDMTIVGPRPPLPEEVSKYSKTDMERLLVKPGCTGLWQVSGRNQLSFSEMVDLDLKYINNASLKMDMKICLKTIWIMFCPNDAY